MKINEWLATHGPKIEVECLSEDPESPTKLRSDLKLGLKINTAKATFMTEGSISARSALSRQNVVPTAQSVRESTELISSMKLRASQCGELHY